MLAYNKQLLQNTFLVAEAKSLQGAGFISREQSNFIEEQLPACHMQSNIFVRAGLFVLGCFLFSSCCGLFSLTTVGFVSNYYGAMLLFYSAFGFVVTEFIIRNRNYFANGIDEAFLVCSQFCLVAGIGISIGGENFLTPFFIAIALTGIVCCIRYADSFSAFFACLGITATVVDVMLKMSAAIRPLLPFVVMLLAVGLLLVHSQLKNSIKGNKFYAKSLNVLYAFCLVLFYFGGNYFIVREGNVWLLDATIQPGSDITLAWLFYAFTGVIPVTYIWLSLLRKDRIMLWVGMLSLAFSVFTIRYYYHIMPAEIALLMGGAALFTITYFAIEKLKTKITGLTSNPDRFTNTNEVLNAEAFAIIQSFGAKQTPHVNPKEVTYGGGDFGGGGAGDSY